MMGEQVSERGSCGLLEWSAFGATYMDTQCVGGMLLDLDAMTEPEVPCPLCNPSEFFDYESYGDAVEATCATCHTAVPASAVTYRDGKALARMVGCPTCGATQPCLLRELTPTAESEDR